MALMAVRVDPTWERLLFEWFMAIREQLILDMYGPCGLCDGMGV